MNAPHAEPSRGDRSSQPEGPMPKDGRPSRRESPGKPRVVGAGAGRWGRACRAAPERSLPGAVGKQPEVGTASALTSKALVACQQPGAGSGLCRKPKIGWCDPRVWHRVLPWARLSLAQYEGTAPLAERPGGSSCRTGVRAEMGGKARCQAMRQQRGAGSTRPLPSPPPPQRCLLR